MTDEKSKRRLRINFKLRMCFSLNWYLKTPISPPVFYIYLYSKHEDPVNVSQPENIRG